MQKTLDVLVSKEFEGMSSKDLKKISIDEIAAKVYNNYLELEQQQWNNTKNLFLGLLEKASQTGLMSTSDAEMHINTLTNVYYAAENYKVSNEGDYDAGLLEDIEEKICKFKANLRQKFVQGHRRSCPCNDCKAIAHSDSE